MERRTCLGPLRGVKTAGQKKEGGANRDEERGEQTKRERGSRPRAFDVTGCVVFTRQCLRACTVCERLIRLAPRVIYWFGDPSPRPPLLYDARLPMTWYSSLGGESAGARAPPRPMAAHLLRWWRARFNNNYKHFSGRTSKRAPLRAPGSGGFRSRAKNFRTLGRKCAAASDHRLVHEWRPRSLFRCRMS